MTARRHLRPGRAPATSPPRLALRLVLCLALLAGAAGLGLALPHLPALVTLDAAGLAAVSAVTPPPAAQVAAMVDVLFGGPVAPFVALAALVAAFLLTRSRRSAGRMAVLLLVPWAASAVLKAIVQRPRPDAALGAVDLVPVPPTTSFPSGHTAFAAALVCATVLTVAAGRVRRLLLVPAVLLIALTAWSRVALGVHYPLDALVSALLVPALSVLLAGALPPPPGSAASRPERTGPSATDPLPGSG